MYFIDNRYEKLDNERNISVTIMRHKGKLFYGRAISAPDEPNPNKIFGGRLSEARAILQALREERNALEEEYKIINNFVKACSCMKRFDEKSPTAKAMYHQLNMAKKRCNRVKKRIAKVKQRIEETIKNRDNYYNLKREKRAKEVNN